MYTPPVTPPKLAVPENTYPNRKEGRVEGVVSEEGEVVTRQVYENVRLDHLLSKELPLAVQSLSGPDTLTQ